MFVEVKNTDMMVGVKYACLHRPDLSIYFTGTFEYRNGDSSVHKFHYMKWHYFIENTYMYNEIRRIQDMYKDFRYYAFVSQKEKIQQAMEQRALDKILKRVVNDDFTW